jgi:hypothetical protein
MSGYRNAYIDSAQEEARREGYDEAQLDTASVLPRLEGWMDAYHDKRLKPRDGQVHLKFMMESERLFKAATKMLEV